MRFAAALLLASVASGASPASRSSPAPLDPDPGLARSGACPRLKRYVACAHEPYARTGCVAVMETLDIMLRNPPAEVRALACRHGAVQLRLLVALQRQLADLLAGSH